MASTSGKPQIALSASMKEDEDYLNSLPGISDSIWASKPRQAQRITGPRISSATQVVNPSANKLLEVKPRSVTTSLNPTAIYSLDPPSRKEISTNSSSTLSFVDWLASSKRPFDRNAYGNPSAAKKIQTKPPQLQFPIPAQTLSTSPNLQSNMAGYVLPHLRTKANLMKPAENSPLVQAPQTQQRPQVPLQNVPSAQNKAPALRNPQAAPRNGNTFHNGVAPVAYAVATPSKMPITPQNLPTPPQQIWGQFAIHPVATVNPVTFTNAQPQPGVWSAPQQQVQLQNNAQPAATTHIVPGVNGQFQNGMRQPVQGQAQAGAVAAGHQQVQPRQTLQPATALHPIISNASQNCTGALSEPQQHYPVRPLTPDDVVIQADNYVPGQPRPGGWPVPDLRFDGGSLGDPPTILTENALEYTTGFRSRDHSAVFHGSTEKGNENLSEDFRATRGNDNALVDWDGKFAPVPCDWEGGRPLFKSDFVSAYIPEWSKQCDYPALVDIVSAGLLPIDNLAVMDQIPQPDCYPDVKHSGDEYRRQNSTASKESMEYTKKREKQEKHRVQNEKLHAAQVQKIMEAPIVTTIFTPKVEMYMRPAEQQDAEGIANVYNYYVNNSILTEDQEPLTVENMMQIIDAARQEKMPFIVAVKGKAPSLTDAQGRRGNSNQPQLPAVETVMGFACAEHHNYGWRGLTGRSRTTCNIQFFVHPGYLRKRVGRNLLDRLVHCLHRGYAYKAGATWINPRNDQVYEPEGSGTWHQLLINVAVDKKTGVKPWLNTFLYDKCSFYFKKETTLKSTGRSNVNHKDAPSFVNIDVYQCEAMSPEEFGPLY